MAKNHLAKGILIALPVVVFCHQTLIESGAPVMRRANLLAQRLSNRRNRLANNGKDFGPIGTRIENPNIDYAMLAKSMGLQAFGPITDPSEIGPTLKKAVQVVKAGEPVLVDAVMQPR